MHMADALLSPAVGGALWAVSAGTLAVCARRIRCDADNPRLPLMGVLGAFVFAAQMINFTVPGTGSSGHLGGGLLLAILLGPCAGLLSIASVLLVQALFFADGGLLALGSNIFNLGVIPCLIAYPLVYRRMVGRNPTQRRRGVASVASATVGLQLGALAVVLQTVLSGISELPFHSFLLLMQPIHGAIGVIEGLITAAVIGFLARTRPELLEGTDQRAAPAAPLKSFIVGATLVTMVTGGILSWFASSHPDGLEWALSKATGETEWSRPAEGVHASLANLQEETALLPDYTLSHGKERSEEEAGGRVEASLSGLVGGALTLVILGGIGFVLRRGTRKVEGSPAP